MEHGRLLVEARGLQGLELGLRELDAAAVVVSDLVATLDLSDRGAAALDAAQLQHGLAVFELAGDILVLVFHWTRS